MDVLSPQALLFRPHVSNGAFSWAHRSLGWVAASSYSFDGLLPSFAILVKRLRSQGRVFLTKFIVGSPEPGGDPQRLDE